MPNTWYVDFNAGLDTRNGTSFAQRVKTLSKAANLSSAGDIVKVMGNAPTNAGGAFWTFNSPLVTLPATLTELLYSDGYWTSAAGGINCSTSTFNPAPKQGGNCATIEANANFSTGKAAYLPLGSAKDLSAYQQISLWVRCDDDLAAAALRIDLCSDTAANTIVDSLTINVTLSANKWTNVTVNKGSALGSSIQSIRLHALKTIKNRIVYIDNVVACKGTTDASCLTLGTLISHDSQTWYHIQSINGTSVYVDGRNGDVAAGAAKGFQGPSDSGTLYVLQTTSANTGDENWAQTFNKNGTSDNPIVITGGWNASDMSVQDGWTSIDRMNWFSSCIELTGATGFVTVDRFNFVRCLDGITYDDTARGYTHSRCTFAGVSNPFIPWPLHYHGMAFDQCNFINCHAGLLIVPSSTLISEGVNWSVTECKFWGMFSSAIALAGSISSPGIKIANCEASGCNKGFLIGCNCSGGFYNNVARNCAGIGFWFGDDNKFVAKNLTSYGNGSQGLAPEIIIDGAIVEIFGLNTNTPGGSQSAQIQVLDSGSAIIYDWTPYTGASPAAKLYDLGGQATGRTNGNIIFSQRENGNAENNSIYSDYGIVSTAGVIGQDGSGPAWKLTPNVNAFATSPIRVHVGKVACPANIQTTLTYYAKKSTSGVNARFRIFGGRHPGVGTAGSDIIATVTGTSFGAYNLVFTPTEDCVVDVFFEAWGSTTENAIVSGPVTINQSSQSKSYALSNPYRAAPVIQGSLRDTSAMSNFITQGAGFVVPWPSTVYLYDPLGRLTHANLINGKSQSHAYDQMGNRTSVTTT